MLQGDAASPIRPPCTDSSRLTETRGVRNHPDPVNGASGPAPSNAPQPSTAAASSCAATGARRLEAFRAHEDTRRQRLPTVRAGVRRSSRLTAGRWARRRCWRVRVRVRRPRVRRPAASVRTLEPSRPRPSASLRECMASVLPLRARDSTITVAVLVLNVAARPGAPEPTREVSPRVWGRFAKNRAKSAPPQRVALIALAHRHLRTAVRERDAAHMPLPASAK